MNNRLLGAEYEDRAAGYLEARGYRILERNFRCRMGEIDLIADDGGVRVFVEVKYRAGTSSGDALSAVDCRKQRKISRVALFYLMRHGLTADTPCRFDVIGINGDQITLVRDAFPYRG